LQVTTLLSMRNWLSLCFWPTYN